MKNVNKKTSRKTSTKKPSASIKSENKESDNVESLVVLSNPKERKKLEGIDERIKFLKTELKSLLGGIKAERDSESFADKSNSASTLCLDTKMPEELESDIKPAGNWKNIKQSQSEPGVFKPNFNSTPSKFSEWLDKTVDEIDSKPSAHMAPANSEIDLTCETSAPDSLPSSFRSSRVPLLSQDCVELLLYKSFLKQNSELFLLDSEASDVELSRSLNKTRLHKCKKSRKAQKRGSKGRATQNSFRPKRSRPWGGRLPSHSGIEIINLDSSTGGSKIPDQSTVCVDLDVSDYDWSEPFGVNMKTQEPHSDVEVLEPSRPKPNDNSYKDLNSNSPEVTESDRSVCHDDSGKIQSKKVWECPVCFERSKGQEIVATQCGHVFCRECLEHHTTKLSNNCPSCRCDLKDKPFITLFNF